MTRREIREEDDDVPLPQLSAHQCPMNAYLCFMGPDDTPAGISNTIVAKINEYARVKVNNMKQFRYFGEVTEDFINDEIPFTTFVKQYLEDECNQMVGLGIRNPMYYNENVER